jgi:hypothetical protein
MKITNIKVLDEKIIAEVALTQKQLDYITSVGIGVLLQAGANMIAIEQGPDVIFDSQEEEEKEVKSEEGVIPTPAVDKNELN